MAFSPGDLRDYLRHVSAWVWREQDDALHYGLKLQEETITEMLLLRMARECSSSGLNVKMFSRTEEGGNKKYKKIGNGADWEWFVETPCCSVGFRVQAKVLSSRITPVKRNLSFGKYEGFPRDKKQTDELISSASSAGYNPIYVFYNHPWISDRSMFSSASHPFSIAGSDWGCSIATANFVKYAPDYKLSSLIKGMLPWHLFFGVDRGCVTRRAMGHLPGGQDFIPEAPRPEWLYFAHDGPHAVNEYLIERKLSGVAYFQFQDFWDE